MEDAAAAGDYDQAMKPAGPYTTNFRSYEAAKKEIDDKKKQYEDALAALQPRLPTTSDPQYVKLEPMQQEIAALQKQMEDAAAAGDYDQALKLAGDLSAKLDAYEAAKKEIDEKKKQYEDALAALQPRLPTTSDPQYAKLEPMQQEIATLQKQM